MDDALVETFSFESTSCILHEYGPPRHVVRGAERNLRVLSTVPDQG
jgi:hypothetical protein